MKIATLNYTRISIQLKLVIFETKQIIIFSKLSEFLNDL